METPGKLDPQHGFLICIRRGILRRARLSPKA